MILRGYFPGCMRLLGTLDDVDAEEIESLLLDGGRCGVQDELVIGAQRGGERVSGERGEIGDQTVEAVDGKTVGSRAVALLGES